MRVASILLTIPLTLAAAACMLPRPLVTQDHSASCVASPAPPGPESQLFVTLRLPDCRAGVRLTDFRSETPRFASIRNDLISFHDRPVWMGELNRRIAGNDGRPPLLFIHGYNNTQEEALDRARTIEQALKQRSPAVVALTWPSYGGETAYFWDEANAEWAGDGAAAVLAALTADAPKLLLVAHSMGNRLALAALQSMSREARRQEIERLVMASPDVDREIVARRLKQGLGVDTTIYVSLKDQPLSGSWRGHGYPRAGDFSWWVTGRDPYYAFAWLPDVEVIDTTAVDGARINLGHTAFVSTRAGRADLCRLARGMGNKRPGLQPLAALKPVQDPRHNYFELVDTSAKDGCDE